ncbi:MAG: hypothetical protein WA463_09105 [Terriglobales bacterium]
MRLSILRLLLALLVLLAWGFAPCVARSAQNPNSNDSSGQQQQAPPDQSKDKKKKDKKDKGSQDDLNTEVFSTAVANNVLNDLRDGLEGHTPRLLLSAFDRDKMDGYLEFEDQIQAFFNRYESFRVYFRIVQSSTDGPKGIVLVDIQLEEIPRGATSPPVRKNGQMRFELERGKKGWKIVDFNPRTFFS